ncbi:zf-HC2 domain-containing protein, partial [Methylocucumis oryzae]
MSYDLITLTSESSSHPSMEQLRQFVVGKLNDAESVAIEAHLFGCDACNQSLNSVSLTDSFTELVRGQ